MSYQEIELERRGHVAVATLNRPKSLNALNAALRADTLELCDEVENDDEIRVLVVTGAGRGFCSGVDLRGATPAAREGSPPQNTRLDEYGWVGRQAMAFYGITKPTIAAVNGVAAGAGMSLALACDLRVGSENARFKTIFLERSLSPDSGMSFFLPRIIGYGRAADLIFTSRMVDAEEAYRLGLLDRLVGADELVDRAVELGEQIASLPPVAMRSAKRVLQQNLQADLEPALRNESRALSFARRAPHDVKESRESFLEKRPPKFTGT